MRRDRNKSPREPRRPSTPVAPAPRRRRGLAARELADPLRLLRRGRPVSFPMPLSGYLRNAFTCTQEGSIGNHRHLDKKSRTSSCLFYIKVLEVSKRKLSHTMKLKTYPDPSTAKGSSTPQASSKRKFSQNKPKD
ncbi:unnamed protein product [Larinioides sclopetarius]|uniref:Uncharacterized protein n=1 Tax=Larinioides sclopetarius TaxID=280406 RepID=A0AAV2AYA5_9ARAC